ncbi:MAG: MGMT family protein [Proteobacteria bacterium]|nr:MGMT family protein [Pseudomonadota bacterium]
MPFLPSGGVTVCYDTRHILSVRISPEIQHFPNVCIAYPDHLACLSDYMAKYISGDTRCPDYAGMKLLFGMPAFSQRVCRALCDIPFGVVRTYQDIARSIGDPKACRAVGAAVGRNPFHVVVPCHRVVSKQGDPWLFSAGPENKRALLAHEKRFSILV